MNRIRFWTVALLSCWVLTGVGAYEKVPGEVVQALGTTRGKMVETGLVFIDGKFIRAPYRVTRAGNQILVNDRPVTGQLVSWEKFLDTQPSSKLKVTEVEEPENAPAGTSASVEDGVDPAAPKDGGNAPAPAEGAAVRPVVRIIEPRVAAAADDLEDFDPKNVPDKMKLSDIPADSEADKARQKRAEEAAKEAAEEETEPAPAAPTAAGDGGEPAEDVDPASPEGEAAAKTKAAAEKAAKPAVKTRKVVSLEGKFEMNFRAQKLLKPIDGYRTKLESTLRRGGYLFFGTGTKPYCHGRTSDAAATRELMKKLPELMGVASESEAFCDSVRSAGLMSYITYQIAQDLYRHKVDSVYLKQRRRELAESDKLNKMLNSHGR